MSESEEPEFLYRYRPTGASLAFTMQEIAGSLWCAYAPTLNDPFDGLGKAISKTEMFRFTRKGLEGVHEMPIEKIWAIAGFTETWNSPTMWAHYADNYSGICIGYSVKELRRLIAKHNNRIDAEFPHDNTQSKIHLRKVNYTDGLPDSFPSELEAAHTKTSHWSYEREWRIITQGALGKGGEATHGTTINMRDAICSIYVGQKCDKPTSRTLARAKDALEQEIDHRHAYPDRSDGTIKLG